MCSTTKEGVAIMEAAGAFVCVGSPSIDSLPVLWSAVSHDQFATDIMQQSNNYLGGFQDTILASICPAKCMHEASVS